MLEFDVNVTADDMFRFNLRHVYTHYQGWLSVVIAALLYFAAIYNWSNPEFTNKPLYVGIATIMLVYMPFNLKLRSKQVVAANEAVYNSLHFTFAPEQGIVVKTGEAEDESAILPWDCIYSVKTSKDALFIYSNKVNAYIVPRRCVGANEDALKKLLMDNVEDFKLNLKGWK